MLDSELVRAFLLVFDAGSLSEAAVRAHITQPAMGRKIQLLEHELGVPLFDRTGRGMKPTLDGLKLELHARPILDQLATLRDRMKSHEVTGSVSLAVTPSIGMKWVADTIETFLALYPAVQLRSAAVLSGAMGSAIGQGQFDLGLLYSPHTNPQLISKELWQERTYFVSGATKVPTEPGAPSRTGLEGQVPAPLPRKSITLREALRAPLILPSSESGIFALLEAEARKLDFQLKPALIIDSVQLALEMVRSGKFAVILTERALFDIRAKRLRAIPIVRPSLKRAAQLASTELALARPSVRALWDHIANRAG